MWGLPNPLPLTYCCAQSNCWNQGAPVAIVVIFSLDYEIHGNGSGDPDELMVKPTWRLLRQLEDHGAKLAIFAEAAEISRFAAYAREGGHDRFHFNPIAEQLRYAVTHGHEVHLHIHPSYLNATVADSSFVQDWSEYDIARLPAARAKEVVFLGRKFLEDLLQTVAPDFRVRAFRAANWSMMPSENIVAALVENGLFVDSSVYLGGRRSGLVNFDYSAAPSEALPWPAAPTDICRRDEAGRLWEYPIYCEMRPLTAFLSLNRFYRVVQGLLHPLAVAGEGPLDSSSAGGKVMNKVRKVVDMVTGRHPWKADFNQASGRQLIAALERAHAKYGSAEGDVPFVLIGHPKLFNRYNEHDLARFLRFVAAHPDRYRFGTYADVIPASAK